MKGALRGAVVGVVLLVWPRAASGLDPTRALTQLRLTVWTQEEHLPQSTVGPMLQTRDGYLWLGTEEGLVRFDGVRFVVTDRQNAPALRSPFVSALTETPDGTLWVGTFGGGISRVRGGKLEAFLPELLGSERIRRFYKGSGGVLFVATSLGGILRIEGERVTRFTVKDGLPSDRIWMMEDDGEGGLWVATHGGGVFRWAGGRVVERLTTREGLPSDFVRVLLRDQDGTLWIGTDSAGLAACRGGRVTRTLTISDGLPGNLIRALCRDRDGSLWIGTEAGLARWRGAGVEVLGLAQGLPSAIIMSLVEDREGNLWVGTAGGGLVRLRDTRFAGITRKEGMPVNGVRAILEDREGRVWAGTDGGGVCQISPGPVACRTHADGLPNDIVLSLSEGRDGSLLAGTEAGGIARLRAGKVIETVNARGSGLPNDRVRAAVEGKDGVLWAGTTAGLARVERGRAVLVTGPGLGDQTIRSLLPLPDGDLLVGTDGAGVVRVDPGGTRTAAVATVTRGLRSDRIFSLSLATGGGVWIGTSGGGLSHLDLADGSIRTLTRRDGLYDDVVFQVVDDGPGGHLWLTSNRGLYQVGRDLVVAAMAGKSADLSGTVFGTADGLPAAECNAGFPGATRTRDGRLWVATVRGIGVIAPAAAFHNPVPPPVQVEEVLVDDRAASEKDGALLVPPAAQRLELRYTALSLRAPERVRFRTLLEGFDRTWVESGGRAAHYTHLEPGRYTFRVMAANDDGVWSTSEARLAFTVLPNWYETWWFRLLSLVLLAAAIGGGIRWRLQAMSRRQLELEAVVAERTASLRAERERAEAASRAKSDFLANMSHELRTPLNAVLGFVQLMERRPGRDEGDREHLAVISRSGEHLLGLINDVLSLSKIEAGLATRVDAPFELGRFVRGLGELLQARAQGKGLTVQVEVDASADVTVESDEGKLRQILLNLLGNAVKFTSEGKVVLRASWDSGRGRFEVEDTGPGIDPKELPTVFEAFVQTETGRQAHDGAGLGLAISRRLARLLGGDLTITSAPGRGMIVRAEVGLPLTSEAPGRERGRRGGRVTGLAPGQPAPLVMVVDDSPENRLLLSETLRAVGCKVEEAQDGENALAMWRKLEPDLVFMDLRMPGMGGLEATSLIRAAAKRGEGRAPRIVAVSASALDHERAEALARGADAFLAKPFREAAVLGLLEELIGVRFADEGIAPEAPAKTSVRLDLERLVTMPPDLLDRLRAAAAGGDGEELLGLATEIGKRDESLGKALGVFSRAYRFDEIEAALSSGDAGTKTRKS